MGALLSGTNSSRPTDWLKEETAGRSKQDASIKSHLDLVSSSVSRRLRGMPPLPRSQHAFALCTGVWQNAKSYRQWADSGPQSEAKPVVKAPTMEDLRLLAGWNVTYSFEKLIQDAFPGCS